ncbi:MULTISPECIES: MFS transporter [unclassified Gordonia (in: high G+C Gram-positive bacteria)]
MTASQTSTRASSPTLILVAAASSVLLLAMIQTLAVPVLPQIGEQLGVSLTTVGWVTTATMLSASALTPLLGRLGDVYGHKRIILIALVITLVGSLLAALTHSIGVLIVARVLQGASFGLFPLAISVLRHELPHQRLTGAMAITASALGVGSGLALVATGLLTRDDADYRRIFWLCVAMTAIVLVMMVFAVPDRRGAGGSVDYVGALVLAVGLVCLLLPTSQGHDWGWGSARVIGLYLAAVVVLVGFWILQSRKRSPLVSVDLLTRRAVLATNTASLCVGFAMFSVFLGATYFVQTPDAIAGYGFGASVLTTSVVFMLPGAVVSILVGPVAGAAVARRGPRVVLLVAAVVGIIGMLLLTFLHANTGEMIVGLVIANVAVAAAYAAMPALLVGNVEPHETGIANSINSIMRTVGGAVGSAVIITVLAAEVAVHSMGPVSVSLPTENAYRVAFLLGAGAFALAALLAAFAIPRHAAHQLTAHQREEEIALGAAGEFATASVDVD